jgi:phosphohistidine phosphatase
MKLYVMRHGEAQPPAAWPAGDKTRPLTEKGQTALKKAAQDWKRLKFPLQTVLTSPLTRAQQTAEIMAEAASLQPTSIPELAAGARADAIRGAATMSAWPEPVLVVGHMPDLALFASRVTGDASLLETVLDTGEVVALDTGDWKNGWGKGKLLWRRKINEWSKLNSL